mmetsp:Transcript_4352/g.10172  ORF Transcript_4352/g.10172 Transcript_4352/m.10172 type:complete len:435 (+) Transcript_4352:15-1319(+)
MSAKKGRWKKDKASPASNVAASPLPAQHREMVNYAGEFAFRGMQMKSELNRTDTTLLDTMAKVLAGNAFYYKGMVCAKEDPSLFEQLMTEVEYGEAWLAGGTKLHRPTCVGSDEWLAKSPAYQKVVHSLVTQFKVRPIRSILNCYRDGKDWTSYHSDQYFEGVNMTVGASFGSTRNISFQHLQVPGSNFEFPQENGDVFAFTEEVNSEFRHAVLPNPKAKAPRVSVIIWGRQESVVPIQFSLSTSAANVLLYNPVEAISFDVQEFAEYGLSPLPHPVVALRGSLQGLEVTEQAFLRFVEEIVALSPGAVIWDGDVFAKTSYTAALPILSKRGIRLAAFVSQQRQTAFESSWRSCEGLEGFTLFITREKLGRDELLLEILRRTEASCIVACGGDRSLHRVAEGKPPSTPMLVVTPSSGLEDLAGIDGFPGVSVVW